MLYPAINQPRSAKHHSPSNILTALVCRHEIIGIITAVGPKVKNFKVGDRAGVGCLVDSCQQCEQCTQEKEEQFCAKAVQTYNMKGFDGQPTYGGYSTHYVVTERWVCVTPACFTLTFSLAVTTFACVNCLLQCAYLMFGHSLTACACFANQLRLHGL